MAKRKSLDQLIFEAKLKSAINKAKYNTIESMADDELLVEGDRVKVSKESIQKRIDKGQKYSDKFLDWVDKNKDKVFTVEYDETQKENFFVALKEDKTRPKWLFWAWDLEKVEDKNEVG